MKRFSKSLIAIIIATILMAIISLPDSVKSKLPGDPVSEWIKEQKVTLGLDLQGGTQLDYRIDLKSAIARNEDGDDSNDVRIQDVIEGVRTTIERRVNGLGVSEPQIYLSNVAGEEHIIVELAGIKDINEAKAVVGKTIQLEFKEMKTEQDAEDITAIQTNADEILKKALKPDADFIKVGENAVTSDGKITFEQNIEKFESELPAQYKGLFPNMTAGEVYNKTVQGSGEYMIDAGGQVAEKKTIKIVQFVSSAEKEKTETTDEQVQASHILIKFADVDPETTRTKEEALALATEVMEKAKAAPDKFADLAIEYSEGPTGPKGGDLGLFGRGQMVAAFEDAAFGMEVGQISDVVESEFGYHIIMLTDRVEASETTKMEKSYTYNEISLDATPDPWKPTGLDGSHFKYATVTYTQIGTPQVNIQFDSDGGDLFEQITERLTGQRLAIFVGGELISAPNVNEKISGGSAVITGDYTLQEALQLANDLNTGAIDAPIILSGQYTISATLGDNALRVSLFAGIVGLIVLILFMILYYRLLGIFAVLALIVYSIIFIFILKTMPIVMTLAGIAGIILSIGMAVDANILIFERTKEELNEGKNFTASIQTGFERAWTSIRDSNISSLITCVILWSFGNSIIKGFALMLGLGIAVSMFTAITVTRQFIQTLTGTKLSKNTFLLGTKEVKIINK
ncbi:protein translocase subunit SecD [Candidatus Peregrinibacteria bacterium]|nr:protein translocase subunit SecD [Candidatus Peregrinibacteria bacterium]